MRVSGFKAALFGAAGAGLVIAGAVPVLSENPERVAAETLQPIDPQDPTEHGDSPVDGLEYADPTEALGLIDAPEPNHEGTATVSFPIDVPPGHGITPELVVSYDSSGGNSWMGVGWDLGVGEIAVDTSFGAPHFSATHESESYSHDGDLLVPNANDAAWEPRTGQTRRDFTHQVEEDFAEIIRHEGAGGPANYFWEVREKDGGVKWYGATPDDGGPAPSVAPTLDENSVVRDENGNIVRWLLSAERDIGVNLIRYEYDIQDYTFGTNGWEAVSSCNPADDVCGQHPYLDRILYTDATSVITGFNGAPYEIDFIRESEMPGKSLPVRIDPDVNARLGYVDVTADRLARIDISWGAPPRTGAPSDYTDLAGRYDFTYTTGWFGKSLLETITQGVSDPHVHTIEYFNELGPANTNPTTGWDGASEWTTTDEVNVVDFSTEWDVSLLGGSVSNAGSGNIYIGFNPAAPSKTGSFGVGLELSGSDTDAVAEWVDLNGDGLPDKVFLDGSAVKFRLNTSGANGTPGFGGDAGTASGIDTLSQDSDFAFQISGEAYPLVALGVGTGLSFSWSSHYFSDVNADGLVDFVSGGSVLFNHLDASGVPTFTADSGDTPVPLEPAALPVISSEQLEEINAQFVLQNPPIDTVRRWVAPFDGTVEIDATVALDTTGEASVDGVRVAVQQNGSEVSSATLEAGGATSAFTTPITRAVAAGDRIYFRVGARTDGQNDLVVWDPTITYQGVGWSADANGLSQTTYDAGGDFTLAGRPDDTVAMPFAGTTIVNGTIDVGAALTDDIDVVVVRHIASLSGSEVVTSPAAPVVAATITAGSTGVTNFSASVPVSVANQTSGSDTIVVADRLEVYVAADSPVDLGQIDWDATITYDESLPVLRADGTDARLTPQGDPSPSPLFEHPVRPHTEFYPGLDPASPAAATSLPDSFTARLRVNALADDPGSAEAVVTFKNTNGIVKYTRPLGDDSNDEFDVDLSPISGADYFVDISVRNGTFTRGGLDLVHFDRETSPDNWTSIDSRLRWTGLQGIFPLSYRGWGVAGYTAADSLAASAIVESAFEIDDSQFNESTPVSEPDRGDVSLDESSAEPAYAFIPAPQSDGGTTGDPVDSDRWNGPREEIWADGTSARTSRLITDVASLTDLGSSSGSGQRSAPTRLGIGGPGLTLMFGAGPFGASAGLSPSWGITDFEDLNGDGYPDVVSAGSVTYTDQLGGYVASRDVDGTDVTNQDLTFSVSGGLDSGMVDIIPNSKGSTNATTGPSAAKGQDASDEGPAYSIGVSGGGGFSWSSPNASGGDDGPGDGDNAAQFGELEADAGNGGAAIQRALSDVNGDGIADRVYTDAQGVWVHYGLGYGFTENSIKLGTGGFESRESASGGAGLGFSLPYGEFGGGVNFLWNSDWNRYGWIDLNGDGILDQFHRIGESDVKVRFGTGSGLLGAIDYGDLVNVELSPGITSNQHFALDQASGIGGGASATAYIGPLCLVACYLVIGGGGGYNQTQTTSTVEIEDINGDGYADVLSSTNDDAVTVALNKQGKTNLLKSVTNPLGGSFSVDYRRDGNTTTHPDSIWVLSEIVEDDGRDAGGPDDAAGDGDDVYKQRITYGGLGYSRVHRDSLGYATVRIEELDDADGLLRATVHDYLNDSVFTAGLLTDVTLIDADGTTAVRGSTVEYQFLDVLATGGDPHDPAVLTPSVVGETDTVGSRGRSIAPLATSHSEYWYDGGSKIFEWRIEYVFDGLGNVLEERDLGDLAIAGDELTTTLVYSACDIAGATGNGCLADQVTAAGAVPSPFQSPGTCINWASYPGAITVTDSTGAVRARSGMAALCDNGAVTEQRVTVSPGVEAITNMTVNQYGDYELIMAPPGEDGDRYTVRYTYDDDRHTDVAMVEEFDVHQSDAAAALAGGIDPARDQVGITSTATFDPLSGRVASRTDANGATRRYVYDELGRNVEISNIAVGGSPTALITIEYNANDPAYAHAIARHQDIFDGNDPAGADDGAGDDTTATIDTVTFVDGLGRITQTKRDARIVAPGETAPRNTRQVTGSARFDQYARPIVEFGPVADDGPAGSFTTAAFGGNPTTLAYDVADFLTEVVEPGARTTTYEYPIEAPTAGDPVLGLTVETDPEGRVTTLAEDVRGFQHLVIETPPFGSDPAMTTRYEVTPLGETTQVIDTTGASTTYSFDMRGDTTSVTTPNSGLTTFEYDLAGRRAGKVNEMMRAAGTEIAYGYDLDRLVTVDNPGLADDVVYEYGLDNSDGRFTAGRVKRIDDRTRIADNTYGPGGALVSQLVEVKRHNWDPTLTEEELEDFRWTTEWSYDGLGRIHTVRYPDAKTLGTVPMGTSVAGLTAPDQLGGLIEEVDEPGELVVYDYDSGGMVRSIGGAEAGISYVEEPIDQFIDGVQTTVFVPRPTEHEYDYLIDRIYDHRLLSIEDQLGNSAVTTRVYDADTSWLTEIVTTSADPDPLVTERVELQDIEYGFDVMGRPLTYENDLPFANRAINGGATEQSFLYDGFGRIVGSAGTFKLKSDTEQRYTYGVEFTPAAPWNIVSKDQHDEYATLRPNGSDKKVWTTDETTYSFDRTLGTAGGPLHVVDDERTDADGVTQVYEYVYNSNGAIETMLATEETSIPTTGKGKKQQPSEPNEWDRTFSWNSLDQMTSADDGSELRIFAYNDAGELYIQDGNLLADDGTQLRESGAGPETIFLNDWVTIRAQKIYKHIWAGDDRLLVKMDTDFTYEDKQLYRHTDLVGSTNIVSDVQGRGFQRHEYLPSGEIWIDDRKEEIRTPFQFADGYYEDLFDLVLFGVRWYDTERELFLSPDPVLVNDVTVLINQPALGGAYTYAAGNGASIIDPSGERFFFAHQKNQVAAQIEANLKDVEDQGKTSTLAKGIGQALRAKQAEAKAAQERAELLDPNPLIEINLVKRTVKLGAPYGPRKKWELPDKSGPATDGTGDAAPPAGAGATGSNGQPDPGGTGAQPGQTSADTSNVDTSSSPPAGSSSSSSSDTSSNRSPSGSNGPSAEDSSSTG